MQAKAMLPLAAAVLAGAMGIQAKPKPKSPAPCRVYFMAAENDSNTMGRSVDGLSKSQGNWYKKHGDAGRFAGICYATPGEKTGNAPLYMVLWGETPLYNAGGRVLRYQTQGVLMFWNPSAKGGKGDAVNVAGLGRPTSRAFHSASTDVLKRALKIIRKRHICLLDPSNKTCVPGT